MVHPVDDYVGAQVRRFRKQAGMSQQVLAARLGLTFQQVQKYERGTNRVSASKLFETAGILGVPVQAFFEGLPVTPTSPSSDDTPSVANDPVLRRLVRVYQSRLNEEDRKRLVELAEVMGRRA